MIHTVDMSFSEDSTLGLQLADHDSQASQRISRFRE